MITLWDQEVIGYQCEFIYFSHEMINYLNSLYNFYELEKYTYKSDRHT